MLSNAVVAALLAGGFFKLGQQQASFRVASIITNITGLFLLFLLIRAIFGFLCRLSDPGKERGS